MSNIRTIVSVPTRPFRLAVIGIMLALMLTLAASPAFAQTPVPAAPANLAAELTDTEGEVLLSWDSAEGATSYRACRRVQTPPGGWNCVNRTTTEALFAGLTLNTTYDFAVASYDGRSFSSWEWTEATVETIVHICPITGLRIPDGYLSVNEVTVSSGGQGFMLTGITRQATVTWSGTEYAPIAGRQFLKVCGVVAAPTNRSAIFWPGYWNNLTADSGIGFVTFDDNTTDWRDVGEIPANQTRAACDLWDVPSDAATIIYAVNNFQADASLYRVDLPEN